jgi:hypothetical protein
MLLKALCFSILDIVLAKKCRPKSIISDAPLDVQLFGIPWNLTANYTVSFYLTPTGKHEVSLSNVLHMTATNEKQSEIVAIYVAPNTTRLSFKMGSFQVSPFTELPLRCRTAVILDAYGSTIRVSYNRTVVALLKSSEARIARSVYLYFSNKWNIPAKAVFGRLTIGDQSQKKAEILNEKASLSLPGISRLRADAYPCTTTIPQNYTMTFDVKPLGAFNNWGNLFHFTMVLEFNIGR